MIINLYLSVKFTFTILSLSFYVSLLLAIRVNFDTYKSPIYTSEGLGPLSDWESESLSTPIALRFLV